MNKYYYYYFKDPHYSSWDLAVEIDGVIAMTQFSNG